MIGGIGNVLLSTYSQTENGEDPLGSLVNLWGQAGTTRTCFNTCARGASIHGDVLNVHTEALLNPNSGFSTFFQRVATHKHTRTHTHTPCHGPFGFLRVNSAQNLRPSIIALFFLLFFFFPFFPLFFF